jgi:molecular chaperone GrpE
MTEDKNTQQDSQSPAEPAEKTELQKVEAQRDEYLGAWKRAAADFINYKKEEGRRFEQLATYAASDFAKDLLPVLDSFALGMNAIEKESPAYKGMLMIRGQLQDALRKKGIERIVVGRGDAFNPEFHEAMMEVEVPPDEAGQENLSGKVLEELVAGYKMGERVLRASKVKLGR